MQRALRTRSSQASNPTAKDLIPSLLPIPHDRPVAFSFEVRDPMFGYEIVVCRFRLPRVDRPLHHP